MPGVIPCRPGFARCERYAIARPFMLDPGRQRFCRKKRQDSLWREFMSLLQTVSSWKGMTLTRGDRAPGESRQTIRRWLDDVDPLLRDDALTVVSELVTNAVRHVPPGPERDWVTVLLEVGDGFVRLEVVDPGTAEREPRFAPLDAGSLRESGRGLGLVAALSVRSGTHVAEPYGHRVVWADLERNVPSGPPGT
ncbi:ATP-binding protein [Nonomuraea sp. NPDC001699]